jgi:hypothetical protein
VLNLARDGLVLVGDAVLLCGFADVDRCNHGVDRFFRGARRLGRLRVSMTPETEG